MAIVHNKNFFALVACAFLLLIPIFPLIISAVDRVVPLLIIHTSSPSVEITNLRAIIIREQKFYPVAVIV